MRYFLQALLQYIFYTIFTYRMTSDSACWYICIPFTLSSLNVVVICRLVYEKYTRSLVSDPFFVKEYTKNFKIMY